MIRGEIKKLAEQSLEYLDPPLVKACLDSMEKIIKNYRGGYIVPPPPPPVKPEPPANPEPPDRPRVKARHVSFSSLGMHTANGWGYPNRTEPLGDLLNAPPDRNLPTSNLLAVLVYQASAMIDLTSAVQNKITQMCKELEGLRRDIKSEQTRVENAREKAAKAEEKAALAREKAALAEASVIPPKVTVIQAGDNWSRLEKRARRKF